MVVTGGESWGPELRLSLGRSTDLSPAGSVSSSRSGDADGSFGEDSAGFSQRQQQRVQQARKTKITVFYDGQICACDVTEMQANAILSMAMRGMDDATPKSSHHQDGCRQQQQLRMAQAASPPLPVPGLSMKRSLQRFLQKRKSRIGAVSPYAHRKQQQQQLSLFPIGS